MGRNREKPYFWQEKPGFSYPVCIAPIRKPFCELDAEETEAYYQWHLSVLQERIDVLSTEVCQALHLPKERMDLSPASLIPLWKWFLGRIEVEETPLARLKAFWNSDPNPEQFKLELLKGMKTQYSLETELIFFDIGKYLGEVFVRNLPGIVWSYYREPENIFVNMPVIVGFTDTSAVPPFPMEFEPVHMAHVQAAKIWKNEQSESDLFNLYLFYKTQNYHSGHVLYPPQCYHVHGV